MERFAHCLACHGWLDYCLRLDELSADTMYVSVCRSRSNRLLRYLTEELGGMIIEATRENCLHVTCLYRKCLLTSGGSVIKVCSFE